MDHEPTSVKFEDLSLDEFMKKEFKFRKTDNVDEVRDNALGLYLEHLSPFFGKHQLLINTGMFNFILEPMKNGNFYSKSKTPLKVKLFLSPELLMASFCDGGEYFKREDVKEHWENKKIHSDKFIHSEKQIGFGFGTNIIYHSADLIYVDTSNNTLYLGVKTDNKTLFY
jgi:hypothetical protein